MLKRMRHGRRGRGRGREGVGEEVRLPDGLVLILKTFWE